MVELTEREKIIIQTMTYLLHSATKTLSLDAKINFLKISLNVRNIYKTQDELKDLILAVQREQETSIQESLNKLGANIG